MTICGIDKFINGIIIHVSSTMYLLLLILYQIVKMLADNDPLKLHVI